MSLRLARARATRAQRSEVGTRSVSAALLALGLAALPLALTWPLALYLGEAFPGEETTDAMIHARQLWWVGRALASFSNPYVSPIMLYPDGARLYFETLVPLDGLLAWLPERLVGPLAAYNLIVLVMLGASALAAWALAWRMSGSATAGAVGALVYVASPYLMNHTRVGHLGVISALWLPLALLGLLEAAATQRRRWVVFAGAMLAAAAYTDLQVALALALLAPLVLARAAAQRPRDTARAAAALAASGILGLVLAAPLLAGVRGEIRSGSDVTPHADQAERNSSDLLALVSPSPFHPLWGGAMRAWYRAHDLDLEDEGVVYPGLAALGLAVAGLAARATRRPFWLLVAVGAALLALGPRVHLGGPDGVLDLGAPTPYALLEQLPLVSIGRTPARFMGVAMLALGVLAALGVVALQARAGALSALVAALLVGFESLPAPLPLAIPPIPAAYQEVIARGCRGPLLELPVDAGGADQKARMYYQTLHGCPISGGYLARGSDETGLTNQWRQVARRDQPSAPAARKLGEEIRALDFQYLVVWKRVYESDAKRGRDARLVRELFGGRPLAEDEESALYCIGAGC